MEWKKIQHDARTDFPKEGQFLAIWKGAFCLCEFDESENHFYIAFLPAQQAGFMRVSHEREPKFTHFMELEYPKDL